MALPSAPPERQIEEEKSFSGDIEVDKLHRSEIPKIQASLQKLASSVQKETRTPVLKAASS